MFLLFGFSGHSKAVRKCDNEQRYFSQRGDCERDLKKKNTHYFYSDIHFLIFFQHELCNVYASWDGKQEADNFHPIQRDGNMYIYIFH